MKIVFLGGSSLMYQALSTKIFFWNSLVFLSHHCVLSGSFIRDPELIFYCPEFSFFYPPTPLYFLKGNDFRVIKKKVPKQPTT